MFYNYNNNKHDLYNFVLASTAFFGKMYHLKNYR